MTRRELILSSAAFLLLSRTASAAFTEGTPLPDLSTFGLTGALPNLKGKVVYLDFWASWCAPCKASFPVLNSWHQQLAAKGVVVLGVNVDENEADMQTFLKKNTIGFPIVRDAEHKLVSTANVKTMPTSFIIDRKGIIRHVHNGFHKKDESTLLAQLNALL
jgi:thiol-disulfide isomerase/thioredoxin